jgi:hypothetical protein
MGKVRTGAIFYRRGIPNDLHLFGAFTQANYPIIQPQKGLIRLLSYNRSNIVSRYNNYLNTNLYGRRYY